MLKFEVQVVDPSTGLPPPKRLKFSAQVTGGAVTVSPKKIKFTANVVQDNNKRSS